MANFDFLQNEADDENVNEEDDGDDGGNADDESDDRDDDVKERRVVKKAKPGIVNILKCVNPQFIFFLTCVCFFQDGFDETVIGDPETDQALAEFDFLADENKSDISDNDSQNKEQGRVEKF
jgi:hypothetical protein